MDIMYLIIFENIHITINRKIYNILYNSFMHKYLMMKLI